MWKGKSQTGYEGRGYDGVQHKIFGNCCETRPFLKSTVTGCLSSSRHPRWLVSTCEKGDLYFEKPPNPFVLPVLGFFGLTFLFARLPFVPGLGLE